MARISNRMHGRDLMTLDLMRMRTATKRKYSSHYIIVLNFNCAVAEAHARENMKIKLNIGS